MDRSAVPPPVTQVMDAAHAWLPGMMAAVEDRLAQRVEGFGEALSADGGATLEAGGKRLRPMLVLLCAGPEAADDALRGATAIELVHMATLVHDDVLDQAPLRRGRPTVFATAGRERATALGDLILSRSFAELCEGEAAPAERQVALLAGASVGLALGELAQRRDSFDLGIGADRYLERCRLKTARLFECACLIGRVGLGDDGAAGPLRTFGEEIGLAFQILDDVLDVEGPAERTGKARGTDLLDGTVTLPLIAARERDPGLGELDLRSLDAAGAEEACERIVASGALAAVREGARRRVRLAKEAVAACDSLSAEQRELLALVADGVVERYA